MAIESSFGFRIAWLIVGLGLAGIFVIGVIVATLQSGPNPVVIGASLFPIGTGIATVIWLGRPAWISVGATEVSYVPPVGSARVFPRSSVRSIVRVPGARGSSTLELRDKDDRKLVAIQQGFTRADLQELARFLDARLTWDLDWRNA